MSSNGFENAIMLTKPAPLAMPVPNPSLSIDKEARKDSNAYIEERFEAAMQRRREFIERFEQDTGMALDATRRDSVADAQHPASLAKANHGAIQLLLETWYERIGIQDMGWTRYNDKTTSRACRTIRQILEKGDEELGIPAEALEDKEVWIARLDSLKWWFFNLSGAFDFLAAYGIGPQKFGSGLVRVEILNHARDGRCTADADHQIALLAAREGDAKLLPGIWPPIRPCGCYEYKLFMKTIGNARGLNAAGDERLQALIGDKIKNDWYAANADAAFDVNGWPQYAVDQRPAKVMMGEEPFEVRYFKQIDEERGITLRVCRAEGRFGQLL